MKYLRLLGFTLALMAAMAMSVQAHSGRTDASGGHRDNKNKSGLGSYHYHHGYSAHLHNGGVCPYETPVEKPTQTPQAPVPTQPPVIASKSITVTNQPNNMKVGESVTVAAVIHPSNSSYIIHSWTSSNTDVAEISNGTIKAKNVGNTSITITTQDGITASFNLQVTEIPITEINVVESIDVPLGKDSPIPIYLEPSSASMASVTWTSYNELIFKVKEYKISPVSPGTAVLRVSYGNIEHYVTVTVIDESTTTKAIQVTSRNSINEHLTSEEIATDYKEDNESNNTNMLPFAGVGGLGLITALAFNKRKKRK